MDMAYTPDTYEALLAAVQSDVVRHAARHADEVDQQARFPIEALSALKRLGALSAAVPRAYGGLGCGLTELGHLCATVAAACSSAGMVLAMHYIQVGCLVRHHANQPFFADYLRNLVAEQWLLASMTSEVGTFGDTRSSICALDSDGQRFSLAKDATTGSYCAHADAILVTCRRNAQSPNSDQLLVLVRREQATLTQTTEWDTLGMRGTCSPGFRLESTGDATQVLPEPYAEISAQTMLPYSHVLWAALWSGIAGDAVARAGASVRTQARKNPGQTPPQAIHLADVSSQLQAMRAGWRMVAREFDLLAEGRASCDAHDDLLGIGWALKLNNLKVQSSEMAPQIVHKALQIIGIAGYKNGGPHSVGRHYRDTLSASLMISNDRIAGKSASMLMVLKDN